MNQEYNDYYDANLAVLKKNHFKTWNYIRENQPAPLGEISFAPNGNPNLTAINSQKDSIIMHNETNPEKESLECLERIPEDFKGFVALLGTGLCYSGLEILKERPHLQYLALFELEAGFFVQALRYIDLSTILNDPRLIISIGEVTNFSETLKPAYQTIQLEESKSLHHTPSFKYNPKGYNQLKDDFFSHINGLNVGGTTTRILGRDFLNNRFQHISTIHHDLLLENIGDQLKDIPAILVAGGPSLDKNIHVLKQAQDKAVIIAVDTVLPALLKNGIQPHFLTCIDPNNLTFEKFADSIQEIDNTSLICSSWINPKTPKIFPANKVLWTFTAKPIEAWLNTLFGGKLLTGGASTVAHLNLITAHMLKCDPVIFIGQDLAFPNSSQSSHATDTVLQGTAPTDIITDHIQGKTVTGINGEILRTDRAFLMMKDFFESAIVKSGIKHINSTEGGANIEGTKILTLQESISRYCKNSINIAQKLKTFYSTTESINTNKMLNEFKNILDKIKKILKKIKASNDIKKSLFKEIKKLKMSGKRIKSFDMLSKSQRTQINKLDKIHKNIDNELIIWKILEEITMDGLKESKRQKQEFSVLENNPDKYIEWLEKNLERLFNINKIRKETLGLLTDNLKMVTSFHQKESKYLQQIYNESDVEQNRLDLARLYIETKNYRLAKPLLEELCNSTPESGIVQFYLGCIAAQSDMNDNAELYFQTAVKYNPELANEIDLHLQERGNEFLNFSNYFKTQPRRELSVKYMVLKGLKYIPNNKQLKKEIGQILDHDLKTIKANFEAKNHQASASLINEWYQRIKDNEKLFDSISSDLISDIFLYQGQLFLSQEDHQNAIISFKTAMKHSPNDHKIHDALIETLFIVGDFNNAIETLKNAIALDNQFATYWETIGDSLKSSGQHKDAIIAYEQCFTHLPGNINLLKKIGDCYLETDQLEAAKAAYEQLKLKMEALGKN